MKTLANGLFAMLAAVFVLSLSAQAIPQDGEPPRVVVGIYDSRAIAVAYIRSEVFSAQMDTLKANLEEAQQAGNAQAAKRLRERGLKLQENSNRMALGKESVEVMLNAIRTRLPEIASDAGADVLVSKWAFSYRDPKSRFVDVTDLLVAEFNPDEATLQVIEELLATKPLSDKELEER